MTLHLVRPVLLGRARHRPILVVAELTGRPADLDRWSGLAGPAVIVVETTAAG